MDSTVSRTIRTTTWSLGHQLLLLKTEPRSGGIAATLAGHSGPLSHTSVNQLQGIVGIFTRNMQRDLDCRVSTRITERGIDMQITGAGYDAIRAYLACLPEYVRSRMEETQPQARGAAVGADSQGALSAG